MWLSAWQHRDWDRHPDRRRHPEQRRPRVRQAPAAPQDEHRQGLMIYDESIAI